MLKVENLSLVKENCKLLDNICFSLNDGESLAIIGNSDCGKTALLECLAGLESDYSGTIISPPRTVLVLANPENQFISFSVEQELAFSLENLAFPPADISVRIEKCLADFSLTALAKQPPALLSGGEKQRTALAAILILEPELLLLNDPCSMLDDKSKAELLKLIFQAGTQQIVLATDNTEESLFCRNLLVLENGQLKFLGETETIYLTHFKEILAMNLDLPLTILEKLSKIGS